MNKLIDQVIIGTGFVACLFFCQPASSQELAFSPQQAKAYELIFTLDTESATPLAQTNHPIDQYLQSTAETIELLVTEREDLFNRYEERFFSRQKKLKDHVLPEDLFLQAEIHLHWAFVYLKFGHEFDAAMSLRQAYNFAQTCRSQYPDFRGILKTWGLLQVMIGSVPDKYGWILSLLGMEGSVEQGLADLEHASDAHLPNAFEAELLRALIRGYILQDPAVAVSTMSQLLSEKPNHKLVLFLASSLSIKSGDSKQAEAWLTELAENKKGLPLHYQHYLFGEVLLHKGAYSNAVNSYGKFLELYKGNNYVKDSHYKIGICYLLSGKKDEALLRFEIAKSAGIESTEADRSAAKELASGELPNVVLLRVRYMTDGGYYDQANDLIAKFTIDDFKTAHDRVEYLYRLARLSHKQNSISESKKFYDSTINEAGDESWYFAPNACLQLGNIFLEEGDDSLAEKYFEKALTYKKHAYKSSIDTKARSALNQIRRK